MVLLRPLHAALCLRPGGMQIVKEVEAAVLDAARRLADAGWRVDEIEDMPLLHEAAEVQERLWLGEGSPRSLRRRPVRATPVR